MTTTTERYTRIPTLKDLSVISKTWDRLKPFLTELMRGEIKFDSLNDESIKALVEFINHFSEEEGSAFDLPLDEVLARLDKALELITESYPYLTDIVFPELTSMAKKWESVAQPFLAKQEAPKDATAKAIAEKQEKQAKIRKLSIKESDKGIPSEEILRRSSIRTQCLNAGLTNSVARKMIQQNVPTNKVPEAIAKALMQRNNRKQR